MPWTIEMPTKIEQIIKKSQEACASTGAKLTNKRKNILVVLANSIAPLSAYEIVEHYRGQFQESLPVMSVYRMLDFLIKEELVHKLETSAQYMLCAHIACEHQHEMPQFLICNRCGSVKEIGIKKQIIEELERSVENMGFMLTQNQLELRGICNECRLQLTSA